MGSSSSSGCSLRRARRFGQRTAGLRRPQAAARQSLRDCFLAKKSPQPSGRACDVEEQPSARGRLRAAGRSATELDAKHLNNNRKRSHPPTFKEVEYTAQNISGSSRGQTSARIRSYPLYRASCSRSRSPASPSRPLPQSRRQPPTPSRRQPPTPSRRPETQRHPETQRRPVHACHLAQSVSIRFERRFISLSRWSCVIVA